MSSEGERTRLGVCLEASEGGVSSRREWSAVLEVADGLGKMRTEN